MKQIAILGPGTVGGGVAEILMKNADTVVETIGGCGAALDMVRRSLQAGKHVVTANKQLIAEHGVELFQLARENRVNLLFEASVGGGIPVLNPMTRCLGANHITAVSGILNGTTNYILTQMLENGAPRGAGEGLRRGRSDGGRRGHRRGAQNVHPRGAGIWEEC